MISTTGFHASSGRKKMNKNQAKYGGKIKL
jgi:hypothetical protein